jgi:hypothetical protein
MTARSGMSTSTTRRSTLGRRRSPPPFPFGERSGTVRGIDLHHAPDDPSHDRGTDLPGTNQIRLSWTGFFRRPAAMTSSVRRDLAAWDCIVRWRRSPGTVTTFTDTTVQGGVMYNYRVRAAADASGRCQLSRPALCVSANRDGKLQPQALLRRRDRAVSAQQSNCGVTINWTPARRAARSPRTCVTTCFAAQPRTSCRRCQSDRRVLCPPDLLRSIAIISRAARPTTTSCGRGRQHREWGRVRCNEDTNSVIVQATPYAANTQSGPGKVRDAAATARRSFCSTSAAREHGRSDLAHRQDRGRSRANHTPGGAYATAMPAPRRPTITGRTVAPRLQTTPLTAAGATVQLGLLGAPSARIPRGWCRRGILRERRRVDRCAGSK